MFSAQLDTCVLYPSYLRDVLLQIAQHGVYRALWSTQILEELARALRARHLDRGHDAHTADAYVVRLLEQMETAFPDAMVENWQPLVPTVTLPDPDDRHVVAAAIVGRADIIVTQNLRDFPPDALPRPLLAQNADVFLLDSLDLHPDAVISAVRTVAARTGRHGPALGPVDVITAIHETPGFADAIRRRLT